MKGGASGAEGLGARIVASADGKTQTRYAINGASFMGQNMLDAHFGFGDAARIDSVTVYWPSGKDQRMTDVEPNQTLIVEEPKP